MMTGTDSIVTSPFFSRHGASGMSDFFPAITGWRWVKARSPAGGAYGSLVAAGEHPSFLCTLGSGHLRARGSSGLTAWPRAVREGRRERTPEPRGRCNKTLL